MSLVNDMLRDLNKRTPVSNKAARVHGTMNSSIESKRPRLRVGLFLAGGLLLGLGAGYFYFESLGVQVVQVPLARVIEPATTVAPGIDANSQPVATPPVQVAAEPAVTATPDTLAIENVVEIRELALQPNGFTLLIAASQETTYDIRDRSAFGLTLHLAGVDRYDRSGTTVPGMSLLLVSDGLDLGIELEQAADFLVQEDAETSEFDILVTASYRSQEISDAGATPAETAQEATAPPASIPTIVASLEAPPSARISERGTLGRVNREMSMEDRDRSISQEAVSLLQSGRLYEAYAQLLTFIGENPDAHQSRETLATLLLAQNEFVQAGTIIDEGLALVPNYAPFKKIKARLLNRDGNVAGAMELLRNVPPAVAADPEYHELLASFYQQNNLHEQAAGTYQELLRTNAQQGRWWAGLGISLEMQKRDSDALSSFQAAMQSPNLEPSLRQYVQNRILSLSAPQ